ncbi:hypothetical protein AB1Y20_022914 [Prymnesium parvum]|uniref:SAM domain-containing protein n=1 Tax=Prymnesium parvum TaxID=97485 RepID=A0AB34JC94_PRYPA
MASDKALRELLADLSLDALAPVFQEEDLTLPLLKSMAWRERDFPGTLAELGVSAADSLKLRDALKAHESAAQRRVADALRGTPAAPPRVHALVLADESSAEALRAFLQSVRLDALWPVLSAENLSLKRLLCLAVDEDELASTLSRLHVRDSHAACLHAALREGRASEAYAAAAAAAPAAPSARANVPPVANGSTDGGSAGSSACEQPQLHAEEPAPDAKPTASNSRERAATSAESILNSSIVASALAACASFDAAAVPRGGCALSADAPDPTPARVTSRTQINHVNPESSCGRRLSGRSNPALQAYLRSKNADPTRANGVGITEVKHVGTLNPGRQKVVPTYTVAEKAASKEALRCGQVRMCSVDKEVFPSDPP